MPTINRVTTDEVSFLKSLTSIDKPINYLYCIGELPADGVPAVAIVGSRKPTNYGKAVAFKLAHDLAAKGVTIVSGLALGIDGEAHRGALAAGGKTIAVMAHGLDSVYPASHRGLALSIIQSGGALLSEYPAGTPPQKHSFIARNRIISAIGDMLAIVEAGSRSGTLSTAGFALEQGKPVGAVPGNINSPMSAGCHNLIKQGARLLASADDILDELGLDQIKSRPMIFGDTPAEEAILQLMRQGLNDGDELLLKSRLEPAMFSQSLSLLEIKGLIRPLGSNHWRLT